MYALYTALTLATLLLGSPYFAYQALRHRKYVGGLGARLLGTTSRPPPGSAGSIWIHAVSVGEVLAARALLPALRERYPHLRLVLSTTTATGQQVAAAQARPVDALFYFPLDLPWSVGRTLDALAPRLFLTIETEIWPNVLRACRARGIATALVNGRISSRSFPRYRLIRGVMRRVLGDVDWFGMQGDESARRIVALGADPGRVTVTGNLKFDAVDSAAAVPDLEGRDAVLRHFRLPPERPVIVAASTLRGEDVPVLEAFERARVRHPGTLLVIAPRHPARFDEVVALAASRGHRVVRRTALPLDAEPPADVVVLDTIGELARVFRLATVVFVGGSLVEAGGHNVLEPAVFGKPILFGPHMQNFGEIAAAFLAADAAVQVKSPGELAGAVEALLGDPARRARLGTAARALLDVHRGAKDRTLAALAALLPPPGTPAGSAAPLQ
jgi:3-deoxy-D-manno-octulosonic-acid transferase